jgi:hypothetical protein
MARASNFYYAGDQQLGSSLGKTLGRALFGDPEAAAQLALRQAQMRNYDASASEATSHAGLYDAQTEGVGIQNTAAKGLPGFISSLFPTAAPPQPAAPVDPLAPLPDAAPASAAPAVTFDPQTFRNGLPALMAAMAQMQGDKVDPNHVIGGLAAMMGSDEFARRGMVAEGHTPGKDFALTPERADEIAQDGYTADFNKGTTVAKINHYNDIPVENIRSGDRRYAADVGYKGRVYAADASAGARRDVAALGKTVGFSLVSDVLPGARMTSGERDPEHNREVGGAEHSYHLPGDGVEAFDIEPGTGARTYADAYAAMRAKYGGRLVEAKDETHRPGHGPHWHFAIADVPGGKSAAAKAPKAVNAAANKMIEAELGSQLKSAGMNISPGAMADIRASVANDYQRTGNAPESVRNVLQRVRERVASAGAPPVEGAQKAPDGHWYVKRGSQFFRVDAS